MGRQRCICGGCDLIDADFGDPVTHPKSGWFPDFKHIEKTGASTPADEGEILRSSDYLVSRRIRAEHWFVDLSLLGDFCDTNGDRLTIEWIEENADDQTAVAIAKIEFEKVATTASSAGQIKITPTLDGSTRPSVYAIEAFSFTGTSLGWKLNSLIRPDAIAIQNASTIYKLPYGSANQTEYSPGKGWRLNTPIGKSKLRISSNHAVTLDRISAGKLLVEELYDGPGFYAIEPRVIKNEECDDHRICPLIYPYVAQDWSADVSFGTIDIHGLHATRRDGCGSNLSEKSITADLPTVAKRSQTITADYSASGPYTPASPAITNNPSTQIYDEAINAQLRIDVAEKVADASMINLDVRLDIFYAPAFGGIGEIVYNGSARDIVVPDWLAITPASTSHENSLSWSAQSYIEQIGSITYSPPAAQDTKTFDEHFWYSYEMTSLRWSVDVPRWADENLPSLTIAGDTATEVSGQPLAISIWRRATKVSHTITPIGGQAITWKPKVFWENITPAGIVIEINP